MDRVLYLLVLYLIVYMWVITFYSVVIAPNKRRLYYSSLVAPIYQ